MHRTTRRSTALLVLVIGLVAALAAPATARQTQLEGVGSFAGGCPAAPAGFGDYPPIVMTGSLVGCWYTDVQSSKDNGAPSGAYFERGEEIFIGSLGVGGPIGTFRTTYHFPSKWDPDVSTGVEVKGRCAHPIVAGSGTGAFAGVTGRVDFKDDIVNAIFLYRGHLLE